MGADQFLLTWNNHRANFASVFSDFRLQGQLVDVTLLCDGGSYPAHRLVLAACSTYFASLFSSLDSSHPVIFLRDVRQSELEALLEFIYRGQVSVANSELGGLIKIAESLRIKGLGDVSQREPASSPTPNGNQQLNLNSGSKRSASPTFPDTHSTTFSLHNTASGVGAASVSSNRGKKVARRNGAPSLVASAEESLKSMVGTSSLPAGGTFMPDLKAILSAANSYTQGLAVASFPALAAAAAAQYTKQNGAYEDNTSGAEENYKLRWCLEKGKEQLQQQQLAVPASKLKTEQQELTEVEIQELEDPSSNDSSFEGSQNACDAASADQLRLTDIGGDCAAVTSADNASATCQLLQQLYTGTSNAGSSLLSTYHQLITPPRRYCSRLKLPYRPSESLLPVGDAVAQPGSTVPTAVADVTSQAKDAKCLTCQLCGANIKHTANFRRHMKQHLNPRRFPCPWCSAAFGRKDNLKTHTRKHHPAEVEAQEGGGVSSSQSITATTTTATAPSHDGSIDAATLPEGDQTDTVDDGAEGEDEAVACDVGIQDVTGDSKGGGNGKTKSSKERRGDEEEEERREEEPLVIDEEDDD
ncbi:BTB/POZ domain, partial [Trinorchestia longiramus]